MSKGSKRRPQQISDEEMARRWALAFGGEAEPEDDPWDEVKRQRPDLWADETEGTE